MITKSKVKQFLKSTEGLDVFDVRSPAEYQKGHIPSAHNLALFNNEERAQVGTIYKQQSKREALLRGLEIVGPKVNDLIKTVEEVTDSRKIGLHCWRGGKRSQSVAWLLNLVGYEVYTLEGGYKAYRNYVLDDFYKCRGKLIVIGGKTGCGKTAVLKCLAKRGEQTIDLESLANHKGSAFGFIGEKPSPSVEQFENDLYATFSKFDLSKRIWIENESRRIGHVLIPEGFWLQIKSAPLINLEVPFERRLAQSISNYSIAAKADLILAFKNIQKRLGGLNTQKAITYLEEDNIEAAAKIALKYYDKQYQYMLEKNETTYIKLLPIQEEVPDEIAKRLIALADEDVFLQNSIE